MDGPASGQSTVPELPFSFTDEKGRSIEIAVTEQRTDPLADMYEHFDGTAQSQGLPPRTRERTVDWLETLFADGLNAVARHDGDPVGHAVLLPYDDTSELAIFVRPDYQSAGIGTELIGGLLDYGRAESVDHVWLTVSHDNRIAMRLYRSAGFEVRNEDRGEYEMERDL